MAAVYVTIDYLDGRSVVKGPLYPDELFNLTSMLFKLNERGIATICFANAKPLTELMRNKPTED
jgi:hypothetical protein